MKHLPPDFAEDLARVLEPPHRGEAAGIIKAASALDDEGLRRFLELFAQRVRESVVPKRGLRRGFSVSGRFARRWGNTRSHQLGRAHRPR
jgi:hypothetical protein